MGCFAFIMSLLSIHALLLFVWLIGSSGESFGSFLAIFWSIVIGVVLFSKWINKKVSFSELSIEDSDDGKGKAIYKLNNLHWTPTGSMQTSIRKYVAFRMHAHNIEDFDWLVKYITAFGYCPNGDIDNPYAEKRIILNGSEYNCRSVNPDYTVTEIYRIPYSDEEKDLVERIRFSKIEPKAKSLTEAMYMKIKTNQCEPTFENALDSIKQLKEENPQFFDLARKSSTLNNVEIVEDIEELEEIKVSPKENEEQVKAARILNQQNWEQINNTEDGRVQYCSRKQFAPNPDDFKWVVGYLSGIGTPENPKNPYSYVITNLGGVEYKSIKVNKYFEGTVIYKFGEIKDTTDEVSSLPQMVKLSLSKTKYLVEERFKKDPVVQYNLQLLKEKEAELKEKKEEYLKMRNWDNDDVMISLSESSTLDIEEYKEKIEDLKDEIEDLKDEIEELKNELEEIKEEIEAEIEDEE